MPWGYTIHGTGTDLYHLVQWFLIYSILGWIVESLYMSFCEKRLVNRGFIFGPICPIYGFGALGAYFLLKPFSGNLPLLYILGALGATTFEFLVAMAMKRFLGEVWWDYREKPFNYKGVICLESTLAWGIYTVVLFAVLHQMVVAVSDSYPRSIGSVAGIVLLCYYLVDFAVHLWMAKMPDASERIEKIRRDFLKKQS